MATDVAAPALVETLYELGRIVTLPPEPDEVEAAVQYLTGTACSARPHSRASRTPCSTSLVRGLDVTWLRDHPARLAAVDPEQVARGRASARCCARRSRLVLDRRSATPGALAGSTGDGHRGHDARRGA